MQLGEDILKLLESQDQRTRGLRLDDHVPNSPAHFALSILFWYGLESILQLFGSDTMFDESMDASDVNSFTSQSFGLYEGGQVTNDPLNISLNINQQKLQLGEDILELLES